MASTDDKPGADRPAAGDEQGAHTAVSHAAAPDLLAFDEDLALFSGQSIAPPARRGPGRPAGSTNRTTSKVREYLLGRGYRDPLEQAAALVSADPRELAAALGGKKVKEVTFGEALAVLAEQGKARGQLLPYFHQEMAKPKEPEREVERHFVVIVDSHEKAQQVQRVINLTATASQTDDTDWAGEPIAIADEFRVRDHD